MSGNNTTKGSYIIRAYHQSTNGDRSLRHHNVADLNAASVTMRRLAESNDPTLYRLELMVVLVEWWKRDGGKPAA
jgi:hypothetical protein